MSTARSASATRRPFGWRRPLTVLLVGVLAPTVIFLALGFEVRGKGTWGWDSAVLDLLRDQPVRLPDDLLHVEGPAAAVAGCLFVLLLATKRWRDAVMFAVALGGALMLETLLKPMFPLPSLSGDGDAAFPIG